MRILHVISSLDPRFGGPQEVLRQLSMAAQRLGQQFDAACFDPPGSAWLSAFPAAVHPLGQRYTHYAFVPGAYSWLKRNVVRYDAVVIHGLWQYHAFAARRAAIASRTPYFVFTHGTLDPWFKHTYPLKHIKKWLVWPWGDYRVLRDATAVLFTSEEEARLAPQSFWLYRVNAVVLGGGIAPPPRGDADQRAAFLGKAPRLAGRRFLLFLGRIHPKKGCDLLLEAFSRVARDDEGLMLVVAGPDDVGWQRRLATDATRLGVANRVVWTGPLFGDEKWGAFRCAEVFVLPSHQENFGIAVVEAMACGLPVLISDKVNIWREILADRAGFVEPDDPDGTLALLRQWLGTSRDERSEMAKNAIGSFEKRFHVDGAARRLVQLVLAAIERRT